jgi:hypothetical protein
MTRGHTELEISTIHMKALKIFTDPIVVDIPTGYSGAEISTDHNWR